jgi:hypothetical protein
MMINDNYYWWNFNTVNQVKSSYTKYSGCYNDLATALDLPSYLKTDSTRMTLDMCAINCNNNGAYSYFGVQAG